MGLTFPPVSATVIHLTSLLQTGFGMFSARAGRGRPGGDEKRFLINFSGKVKKTGATNYTYTKDANNNNNPSTAFTRSNSNPTALGAPDANTAGQKWTP